MDILEQKRKRIETVVKIVALLGIAFVVSPFIFATIQGLVGLVASGSIGLIAINLAPWFAAKVANWRLKALKHEASLNPIETLENQFREREAAMQQYRQNIKELHAEVENFRTMVANHKESYPGDTTFDEKYGKMQALLQNRALKYKAAQAKLVAFGEVIEKKRSEWEVAKAISKMERAAGVGEDFISKLMADTAIGSVQTHLNMAFSELEISLLDETGQKAALPKPVAELKAVSDGPVSLDLDFENVNEKENA